MIPSNNIFISGGDPLLSNASNLDTKMQELTALKALIEQKEQSLSQLKTQMSQPQSKPVSQTPVWDEIDAILQGMNDDEYAYVSQNDEFIESSQNISTILQGAYMEMMRPIIECSEKGKSALEAHLTLVKRLRKAATAEVSKQMTDFKEYTEKYPDMTYADYLKMKNGSLKSNKK